MTRSKKRKLESKKKTKGNKKIILSLIAVSVIVFSITYRITANNIDKQQDKNKVEASELINRMLEKNRLEGIK